MENRRSRKAHLHELDQIFMMGFDVWSTGSMEEYIAICHSSRKYQQGCWYVLENNHGTLMSSLIVYKLGINKYGIGSIATPKELRGKGLASKLISDVIQKIEQESQDAVIFLYSDIHPEFYERFNFIRLPMSAQRYGKTTCMVRGIDVEQFVVQSSTPEYF